MEVITASTVINSALLWNIYYQKQFFSPLSIFSWEKQLYKRLCLSVRGSMGPWVRDLFFLNSKFI